MIQECKIHGETKFIKRNDGGFRCGKCATEAVQKRRWKVKAMAIEYKGGSCIHCGYNKCPDALEFHHMNPAQKDFTLSGNGHCKSWEKVKAELDKCILLCANCHRELHAS